MYIHRLSYSDDVHQVGIEAFQETVTSELKNRTYAKRQVIDHIKPLVAQDKALTKEDSAFKLNAAKLKITPLILCAIRR